MPDAGLISTLPNTFSLPSSILRQIVIEFLVIVSLATFKPVPSRNEWNTKNPDSQLDRLVYRSFFSFFNLFSLDLYTYTHFSWFSLMYLFLRFFSLFPSLFFPFFFFFVCYSFSFTLIFFILNWYRWPSWSNVAE